MFKFSHILRTVIAFFAVAGTVHAVDCNVEGVQFSDLSVAQAEVLASKGGQCAAVEASSFKYYDTGYFLVDGEKIDPLDLAATDPYDMAGVEAIYYGYIGYSVTEAPRDSVWGYRFDTTMDPGKVVGDISNPRYLQYGDLNVDLLFMGDQVNDSVESAKADRIRIYKALMKSKELKAAVKVTGVFRNWRNTGALYLAGSSIEIIDTKPEK